MSGRALLWLAVLVPVCAFSVWLTADDLPEDGRLAAWLVFAVAFAAGLAGAFAVRAVEPRFARVPWLNRLMIPVVFAALLGYPAIRDALSTRWELALLGLVAGVLIGIPLVYSLAGRAGARG